jgi:5-methylcytosine-specific restriction enzyme A
MPKRFCACTGCPACNVTSGTHGALFDREATGTTKCQPCQEQARIRKNTDPPGRPTAAQRGYGNEWRKVSAQVTAGATACHWCEGEFTEADPATADHLVPLARGGTNDLANLVPAHRTCNSRRGGQMRKQKHASP